MKAPLSATTLGVLALLKERVEEGEVLYGPFDPKSNRDYTKEALEEVIDSLFYLAARLYQMKGGTR